MGGILQGVGTAVTSGIGMAQKNAAALTQATSNEQLLSTKQQLATSQGTLAAGQARMQGAQVAAAQRTGYANSGIDATTGTAAAVQADTAAKSELDAQTIQNNAAREAWGFKLQRAQNRSNLVSTMDNNTIEGVSGMITGGSQEINGAMSAAGSMGGG